MIKQFPRCPGFDPHSGIGMRAFVVIRAQTIFFGLTLI